MSNYRPVIGITMRHDLDTERFYLARAYSEAVEAAGGDPLHIPLIPKDDYITSLMSRVDAVLLPGSASDVDPWRYGKEPHKALGSVHPLKDETDLLVLKIVEERRLPLLAICFGMQILNVSRGGALVQDIESQMPEAIKHEQGAPRERRSHGIRLLPEGFVARFAEGENVRVNSHHHQGIETLGEMLRATAWSSDGLVEAVEDTRGDRWVVGVQWHPEIDWQQEQFAINIFTAFVEAAGQNEGD
ncbi:MAG TPA: gamma-glutamyl-gamma-aminobutyrate hydrolase family protein [Pyrinomonadaceae bacterium]|nr:gamma-glutamyl-gamma-aminobutyrate hydrolase family protein [Pyrinomonadaceae bacterium]